MGPGLKRNLHRLGVGGRQRWHHESVEHCDRIETVPRMSGVA